MSPEFLPTVLFRCEGFEIQVEFFIFLLIKRLLLILSVDVFNELIAAEVLLAYTTKLRTVRNEILGFLDTIVGDSFDTMA